MINFLKRLWYGEKYKKPKEPKNLPQIDPIVVTSTNDLVKRAVESEQFKKKMLSDRNEEYKRREREAEDQAAVRSIVIQSESYQAANNSSSYSYSSSCSSSSDSSGSDSGSSSSGGCE